MILVALLLGLALWHQPVWADTRTVNGSDLCSDITGSPNYCTVQAAIDAATPGDTVLVAAGIYSETLVISKTLTLQSVGGKDVTTVSANSNGALGTILVTNEVSGVVISGFTIQGIDNPSPSLRSAALFFQGDHDNVQVVNNEFVANGDLALYTEATATNTDYLIDNNVFAGTTFSATQPGGSGFDQELVESNVPRPLVLISGGLGGGATHNITFTNNSIVGVAGGLNSSNEEQGNSLVIVDANGAMLAGNLFAGTTNRLAFSLISRGLATTITNNTFSRAGMGSNTGHLYVENQTSDLKSLVAANSFDRGAFADVGNGAVFTRINRALASANAGESVRALPGLYEENITYGNAVSLIGSGSGAATSCGAGNPTVDTIVRAATGDLLHLTASGVDSNHKLLLNHLRLELLATATPQVGIFVDANVSNIKLDDVHMVGSAPTPLSGQTGLLVRQEASITDWDILNSAFNCLDHGLWFDLSNAASAGTVAENLLIANNQFRNNAVHAIYAEKLANAWLQGNQFINNDQVVAQSNADAHTGAGVDINLKFGTYSNINILDNTFTGNSLGAREGGALLIKARDDGSFSSPPATLNAITVTNNLITNNERGIRLGEPGQTNAGPAQVTITNNIILSNTPGYAGVDGSIYGGIVDWSASPSVVATRNALLTNSGSNIAKINGSGLDGTCNWYGSSAGPGATVTPAVAASPWLITSDLNGMCKLGSIAIRVAVVGGSAFANSDWAFTGDVGNFTVAAAGGTYNAANLHAASYTITQTLDSDYDVTVNCGSGVQTSASVTVNLPMAQDAACVFTNTLKAATLVVTKIVINDNGGSGVVADFPLFVNGIPVTSGQVNTFLPGSYTVSESNAGSYTASIGGDCASNGAVTLTPGVTKSCTLTNNDPPQGTLNLTKIVVGGSAYAPVAGWQFSLGATAFTMPASGGNRLLTDISPGTYTLSETSDPDYTTTLNCGAGVVQGTSAQITLALGQTVSCIVTNTVKSATLTVTKIVVNDNGGTSQVADFPLFVNGIAVTSGQANDFMPGNYTVSENNVGGYQATFSGDCASNGAVTLTPGVTKSCTLTNNDPPQGTLNLTKIVVGGSAYAPVNGWQFNLGATAFTVPASGGNRLLTDISPGTYTLSETSDPDYTTTLNCGAGVVQGTSAQITLALGQTVSCIVTNTVKSATLTVTKIVVNDSGGTAQVADFPLFVNGVPVTSGQANDFLPGSYTVSENNAGGYTATFSGDCASNGAVTLTPGVTKSCTLTNNDPSQGTLNLTKIVVGGSAYAPVAGWQFSLGATAFTMPAAGGNRLLTDITPGTYTLSETSDPDYLASVNCGNGATLGSNMTITLTAGQTVSCVFTNTVKSATLTVTKIVVNDSGGTAQVADFPLFVNGVPVTSGQANDFLPGNYTVSENNAGGYTATFSGDCASNGAVTLTPGVTKSCTLTNNDPSQGTLNLTKIVVGGSAYAPVAGWQFSLGATAFTMPAAGGNRLLTDITPGTYTLSETSDSDYLTSINCGSGTTLGSNLTITLTAGQTVSCIVTNTVKSATLIVTKIVVNDNGGTAQVADFPLFVNGTPVTSGQATDFLPGNYTVSENNAGGYQATFSGDCASNGAVILTPGVTKSCILTNNDPSQGTLNLTKVVVGGSSFAPSGGWQFFLGNTPILLPAGGGTTQLTNVIVGSYTISEVVDADYTTSFNCGNGTTLGNGTQLTFTVGQRISCVFTNTIKSATLTVNKVVVNDSGGSAVASDFPLFVDNVAVVNGIAISVTPGLHVVTEQAGNYGGTFSGNCSANGAITLAPGDNKVCTLTNNDPGQGTLNLTKIVVGSNAYAPATGWQFSLGANTLAFPASGGNRILTDISPGTYTLSETSDPDYTTTLNCGAGVVQGTSTQITLSLGQTVSCIVTNTVKSATLTVTKIVVNDNGGTAQVADFPLFVNGVPVTSGQANDFLPGNYTVSENNAGGYTATFSGDCASNGAVTLTPGVTKSCTLTNNDPSQGTLNLTKIVMGGSAYAPVNGWQFSLGATAFTLPASGGNRLLTDIIPGSYTLSETSDPDYDASYNCGNGTTLGSNMTITLTAGQTVSCVFTNTVKSATLTVTKIVVNDNGGTAQVADFPLFVNGTPVTSGQANDFLPGSYTVSENNAGGYQAIFSGDCASNGAVILTPGVTKSCTLTNNDPSQGTLNLTKIVVGGSTYAPVAGWQFSLGATPFTVPAAGGNRLLTNINPGTYTLSEVADPDYTTSYNCGAGTIVGTSTQISVALGETVSCIVTNTVKSATLTVTKIVVNDSGGTAQVEDFPLFVNGMAVTSGQANDFLPGSYTVSENNAGGYQATFSGDCASNGAVILTPGSVKRCTLTNNDPGQGTLNLTKIVVGSSAYAPMNGWQFNLGDVAFTLPASGGNRLLTDLTTGNYTLSETSDPGYTTTLNCGEGVMQGTSTQITLSLGQTVNCVFTNTLKSASLIVTKVVVNDSGGNATADDFPLLLNNTPLVDANAVELAPGTYLISGKTPKGYLLSFTGDCADNGVVRLVPGQVNRCVATIDDIPTGTPVAAMVMVKTAGLLPDTCALDVDISVVKGSKVYYCYTVTNIGNVPLSTHSLTDTQFGNVFSALHKSILPGQTVSTVDLGIEQSADILDEVFGTGTWSALASDDVLSTTASSLTRVTLGSEDFSLTVTAAYEPQAQGGHTTIGAKIVYQIHLVNTGTARLYNTQISFLVPAGTVYRAGADLWSCEDGAPVETLCRYTVGLLKPGEEVVIPLTLNIITEIIVERLALQIRADSAGTPITPASSKELLVYGPDALNGSYLFLPHLQQ